MAALVAAANAPANVVMAPSLPKVSVVPAPLITAPKIRNTLHTVAAVTNLIIRVPTAVPKTLGIVGKHLQKYLFCFPGKNLLLN